METMEPRQDGYSRDEVARRLGISATSVAEWAKRNDVRGWRVGRSSRYPLKPVDIARAETLSHFDAVADLQPDGSAPTVQLPGREDAVPTAQKISSLQSEVRDLESMLRQLVAARASFRTSVEGLLAGEMQLLDTVLAAAVSKDPEV